MKKIILISLFSFFIKFFAVSQTDTSAYTQKDTSYWQKSFNGGINFNQASFSNWAGGGVNSIALGTVVNARALYQKEKWSWDNVADLQLGFVSQKEIGVRKAADQVFLNSIVGYKIAPKFDLFMSGTFNTFFAPGYLYGAKKTAPDIGGDSLVSKFMSPAQLTFACGVAYKPNDWFSLRVSPFAPRFTFVLDDEVRPLLNGIRQKAYGVETGKKVRAEWLALQLQAEINKNLTENISLKARYQMYLSYETFDPDHRLDLLLAAKVSKYISSTFGFTAVYDSDYTKEIQLQQTLGIGLLYNVSTFKTKK
ncbi:MAG: DUF3078 domain-containing protein [Verrucomicrobia bacterium]|nr:DUF3078 domain-containing protein [Cytophagales bacterium]